MSSEAIRFYCGVGERAYNYHPGCIGAYDCVSTVCGTTRKKVNQVAIPSGVCVFQDSGAFNDTCLQKRRQVRHLFLLIEQSLFLSDALKRQEEQVDRFGYAKLLEARASYDVFHAFM